MQKNGYIQNILQGRAIYAAIEDRIDFYEKDRRGDLQSKENMLVKVADGSHITLGNRGQFMPQICQVS